MIFGKKIPAKIFRSNSDTGVTDQILPSTEIPVFTVRKFMGVILQGLRPETIVSPPFGVDPHQLRLVFADWPKGLSEDFPILSSDALVIDDANYAVVGALFFPGSHIELYIRISVS
jgi:hypothetical protein